MRWFHELVPTGRLSRGGFWLRHLTLVPLGIFLSIATEQLLGRPTDLPLVFLTTLLLISIWGRRLHDRGRSAWWLLATGIPVIGPLWLMFECACRKTSPSASRFDASSATQAEYLVVQEAQQP
ncbi:MAG TPA: DUF805 domain-containing protein [Burkholderiaceae bacterium]|jgi:uncharacterized membrane protein YhaH (DUF805 family)